MTFFQLSSVWIFVTTWICLRFQNAQVTQPTIDLHNGTTSDVFQPFTSAGVLEDDDVCDVAFIVKTIQTVVSVMHWKSIVVIHDGRQELLVHYVLDSLWKQGIYACITDIRHQHDQSVRAYCQNQESEVHIITLCEDENLHLNKNIFDKNESKIKTLFIVSPNIATIQHDNIFKDSIFTNVALLRPYNPYGIEDGVCYSNLDLSSLMYIKDGHRSFERRKIITRTDLNLTKNIVYPNMNFGLNRKKLLISALKSEPFCILSNVSGTLQIRGLYGEILDQLVKDLNFTYEIVLPKDGEWGRINDNGSWTGLVRLLENKEIDMVLAPLAVSVERNQVIDYGTTVYYDHSSFLMRSNAGGIRWYTVIKPFQIQTFVVLFAVFMGSTFCLLLVEKCSILSHGGEKSIMPTFGECLWYFFGASLAQGGTYETRSHSGALFISLFWIYSVIVLVFYSGSLMSQLTVLKEQNMMETASDLARQNRLTYGTLGGSYYSMKLKNSSRPIYRVLYNNIMEFYKTDPEVLSTDHEVHYRKVKTEDYILILDKVYMTLKAATDCDLHISSATFDVVQEAPGFPKGSPIRDVISEQILNYHDNGLIDLWASKSMPLNECDDLEKVHAQSLLMDDVISAFVLLIIGFAVALIIFVIEKFCKCCSQVEHCSI